MLITDVRLCVEKILVFLQSCT